MIRFTTPLAVCMEVDRVSASSLRMYAVRTSIKISKGIPSRI